MVFLWDKVTAIAPSPLFPTNFDKNTMVLLNPKSNEKRSPNLHI
ncbi:hypothetical protein [Nostoc sp. FACHB-892]|nr:hypothetical protein [Nostoc sp. FACHB-892]